MNEYSGKIYTEREKHIGKPATLTFFDYIKGKDKSGEKPKNATVVDIRDYE